MTRPMAFSSAALLWFDRLRLVRFSLRPLASTLRPALSDLSHLGLSCPVASFPSLRRRRCLFFRISFSRPLSAASFHISTFPISCVSSSLPPTLPRPHDSFFPPFSSSPVSACAASSFCSSFCSYLISFVSFCFLSHFSSRPTSPRALSSFCSAFLAWMFCIFSFLFPSADSSSSVLSLLNISVQKRQIFRQQNGMKHASSVLSVHLEPVLRQAALFSKQVPMKT